MHSGAPARIRLMPAAQDTGVAFFRADLPEDAGPIRAHADGVATTDLGTTVRNPAGASVATVEHLMAACAGLGIDNLQVSIDGPEMPILDGSSAPFVDAFLAAGIRPQAGARRRIRIRDRIAVEVGSKRAALEPAASSEFEVTIRFADPTIGTQRRRFVNTPEAFLEEIAQARTFGFLADVDRLHAAGRGRGASLENTIVIDGGKVINPEGVRFQDEFVRHKILDAIGDLYLAGGPILGRYVADQPGHGLNAALVRALLNAPQAWAWEPDSDAVETLSPLRSAVA